MALTDNPMSLVVTGNVTIGAELEVIVPTEETFLINKNIEANDILYEEVSITMELLYYIFPVMQNLARVMMITLL